MRIIYSFLLILILVSCNRKAVYEKIYEIENESWNVKNVLNFPLEITDTSTSYNFYINLRNKTDYKYQNIYLLFHTQFPNNEVSKDTIHFKLTNRLGQWVGSGIGDIVDNKIWFKTNTKFPTKGAYNFKIEQGMREENLKGILDVGFTLERAE